MTTIRRLIPAATPCHECGTEYSGITCPTCKEDRPAIAALKNITARERAAAPVVAGLPACRYFPKALCACGQRGTCLSAA